MHFLIQNGALIDLNSLLPANSGWQLYNATGINDADQIVGDGILNGQYEGFLLDLNTATPEAGSGILFVRAAGCGEAPSDVSHRQAVPIFYRINTTKLGGLAATGNCAGLM